MLTFVHIERGALADAEDLELHGCPRNDDDDDDDKNYHHDQSLKLLAMGREDAARQPPIRLQQDMTMTDVNDDD